MVMQAKPKKCTVYMYGIGASFTDSVAYITEVQPVEPAYIETSTGFLYDRSLYALQLRNLLEEQYGIKDPTCVVFFSKKKRSMERSREKIKKGYIAGDGFRVMRMPLGAFSFTPEPWEMHEVTDPFAETH